jgi:hypothetical protein
MNTIRTAQGLAGLGAVLGLLAAIPALAADTRPMPGYWEATNKATLLITKSKTERRCLVAADINKFLNNPSMKHYTCTYPQRRVADGQIKLKGTCATKEGQVAEVWATGSYSPTDFHLDMTLSTKLGGLPLSANGSTDAHRLGDVCPDDAIRSDEAKAEQARSGGGR